MRHACLAHNALTSVCVYKNSATFAKYATRNNVLANAGV